MGNALDRARAAQAENEVLKVSAQETTAALQETTAELKNLKGELKWLQLHTKREQELARDPKRFRRELIVCAVVAVGAVAPQGSWTARLTVFASYAAANHHPTKSWRI